MTQSFWHSQGKDIATALRNIITEPCVLYWSVVTQIKDSSTKSILDAVTFVSRLEILSAEELSPSVFRCMTQAESVSTDGQEPLFHFNQQQEYLIELKTIHRISPLNLRLYTGPADSEEFARQMIALEEFRHFQALSKFAANKN